MKLDFSALRYYRTNQSKINIFFSFMISYMINFFLEKI